MSLPHTFPPTRTWRLIWNHSLMAVLTQPELAWKWDPS